MTHCRIEVPYETEKRPRSMVPPYPERAKAITLQQFGRYTLDQTRAMHADRSRRLRKIH